MKEVILACLCLLTVLAADAQKHFAQDGWAPLDKKSMNEVGKSIVTDDFSKALWLVEWGFINNNGVMTDAHKWTEKNQVWIMVDDVMYHINTDDGNFIYDAKIKDGMVKITNQSKITAKGNVTTNSSYDGWLKLMSVKNVAGTPHILTVDNLGVYRIFCIIPYSVGQMMENL